jgi:hypothetical protein
LVRLQRSSHAPGSQAPWSIHSTSSSNVGKELESSLTFLRYGKFRLWHA